MHHPLLDEAGFFSAGFEGGDLGVHVTEHARDSIPFRQIRHRDLAVAYLGETQLRICLSSRDFLEILANAALGKVVIDESRIDLRVVDPDAGAVLRRSQV